MRCLALAAMLFATASAVAQTPPAAPAAAIDPARLATAQRVANRLLPEGTYRTMMKAMTDQVLGMVTNQMTDLPIRDLVKMGGMSEADVAKLGPATTRQIMAIFDPAFDRRMDITMRVMFDEMGALMTTMEPEYRAGLGEALASRFDGAQLTELDRFFATPTGAAYAGQSMALYTDPAMMRRMQAMMPRIMGAMPAIMQKVQAATAGLPKARDPKTLTKAQQAQLEALILPAKDAK